VVVRFDVPAALLAFTNHDFEKVVEPGEVTLWVGGSCADRETAASLVLTGAVHPIAGELPALTSVTVTRRPETD
jgi:hypothetical protein